MPVLSRPTNLESVWASQGNLSAPDQEKILEGWIEEIPLNIIANWIENRQDKAILYLFQNGIAEWHPSTEYPKNCLVRQGDVFYKSIESSKGAPPAETPIAWRIAFDDYGSASDVMKLLQELIDIEGKLPLYVSKKNPVMDNPATAPAFWADTGRPSTVEDDTRIGFGFKDSKNTGMFKDSGNNVSVYKEGAQIASFTDDQKDSDVITRGMLKEILKVYQIPVGTTIITQREANPATYLGYGTWVRDCEGRVPVGVSTDISAETPDWMKVVNTEFGEREVTLNVDQIPPHDHVLRGRHTDGGGGGVQSGAIQNQRVAVTEKTGGGLPHNNIQPSVTKFMYTRTA